MRHGIFQWDDLKAASNRSKHGITFEEAISVFDDVFLSTERDRAHSDFEERFIAIGLSSLLRVLLVVHLSGGETIRIISARRATPSERADYESQFQ